MYDIERRVMETAVYISRTKCTVREAASHLGTSKSTVHKDMSERLLQIDMNLYEQVEKILKHNKEVRHLRGGEATKMKYLKNKEDTKNSNNK